jgi:hypothetical protein
MSRDTDIAYIDAEITKLQTQQQEIKGKFETYRDEVNSTIQGLIREAGIWEQLNIMEVTRNKAQEQAQIKVNTLGGKIGELENIRKFLLKRAETENPKQPNGNIPSVIEAGFPAPAVMLPEEEQVELLRPSASPLTVKELGDWMGVDHAHAQVSDSPKKKHIPPTPPDFDSL